ncbi:hypothetical protein [Frankia sp. QA3]|uniref:hypothetical protein n=1 Tax=Frankia sp. QA3 TaxID=710111 RepID=UPI000269BDDC|nr:hypothetical protein [Frankia sp. QA3]EIV92328.1 hypothetical protein FraQA3DRAFT_1869 [Frankia sp. QA3]
MHPVRGLLAGAAAGAAGTTALNAVTYLDMAWRGRPASDTPQRSVESLAARVDVDIPGAGDTRANRLQGLGLLAGLATGVLTGALAGVLRAFGLRPGPLAGAVLTGAGAMGAADGSMTALGVSDPRTWDAAGWAADAVPHLAYGLVTDLTLRALTPTP